MHSLTSRRTMPQVVRLHLQEPLLLTRIQPRSRVRRVGSPTSFDHEAAHLNSVPDAKASKSRS